MIDIIVALIYLFVPIVEKFNEVIFGRVNGEKVFNPTTGCVVVYPMFPLPTFELVTLETSLILVIIETLAL